MDRKSLDPPSRLLETWRNLNRDRKGEPSELLQQMRDVTERGQNFAKQPYMQALAERIWRVVEQPHMRELRRIEASRVTGRLMGRMRPVSPHQPSKRKRKPGGGRKPLHTLERIAEGICVVAADLKFQSKQPVRRYAKQASRAAIPCCMN